MHSCKTILCRKYNSQHTNVILLLMRQWHVRKRFLVIVYSCELLLFFFFASIYYIHKLNYLRDTLLTTDGGRGDGKGRVIVLAGVKSYWEKTLNEKTFRNRVVIFSRFTSDLWECRAQEDKNNLRLKYDFYDWTRSFRFRLVGINKKENAILKSAVCRRRCCRSHNLYNPYIIPRRDSVLQNNEYKRSINKLIIINNSPRL